MKTTLRFLLLLFCGTVDSHLFFVQVCFSRVGVVEIVLVPYLVTNVIVTFFI